MVTVQIGTESQDLSDVTESWIAQQIVRRQRDGQPVCIQVRIQEGELEMRLNSGDCPAAGGGGRRPRPREAAIFDLWDHLGMNAADVAPGGLTAFLKQLAAKHL